VCLLACFVQVRLQLASFPADLTLLKPSSSSSYTLPARFLVPKQQFNPGTKTAPPDAGKALQPPRACVETIPKYFIKIKIKINN
jgi:hypothetical protein